MVLEFPLQLKRTFYHVINMGNSGPLLYIMSLIPTLIVIKLRTLENQGRLCLNFSSDIESLSYDTKSP